MKLYSIYFSPTGGTKRVVDILAGTWDCEKETIDLIKGKEDKETEGSESYSFTEEDICLIAAPSFGGRVPALAAERLESLKGNRAKAIAVVVFGNRAIDDTLLELKNIMERAGFVCTAGVEAVAEHSIIREFGAGRPDAADEKQLREFAERIREKLARQQEEGGCGEGKELSVPGNFPYKKYGVIPMNPTGDRHCSRCGKCVQECPVQAIPEDKPASVDKDRCISCMRCVSVCPQKARRVNPVLLLGAKEKLKKVCAERKENRLYI